MTRREIAFLAEKEKVVHLDDLILRRSLMAYLGHLSRPLIGELADILGESLDWSKSQKETEIERTYQILQGNYGVRL
jgi:glycerol-3-phosphate dehydrogenase